MYLNKYDNLLRQSHAIIATEVIGNILRWTDKHLCLKHMPVITNYSKLCSHTSSESKPDCVISVSFNAATNMWEALSEAQPFKIRDTSSVAAKVARNAAMLCTLPTWLA